MRFVYFLGSFVLLLGTACSTVNPPEPQPNFIIRYQNASATHLPTGLQGRNMDARPGDIDQDGDLDLVVAQEFGPNIILLNDGTGQFTNASAARLPQVVHDSEDIGLADFDGDNDLDLIFVSEDDQTNEFYLNDGTGHFTAAHNRIPVSGTSNAVLAADVDGDEDIDILIGNAGQNVLLLNDGTGHFEDVTGVQYPASGGTTQDLELGDIDNDGDPDLIVANEESNQLLLNNGNGFFTDVTETQLPNTNGETREADFGDIDGDGDLDLFFANVAFQTGPPQNRLLLNDGNGFFTDVTETHIPQETKNTADADFIDLDADGDLDMVLANAFGGNYQVYYNDGTGHFTDNTTTLFTTIPQGDGVDIEAADFNNDQHPDLYLTHYQGKDFLFLTELVF